MKILKREDQIIHILKVFGKTNETLNSSTTGKLRLSYPESITPEEIPF